MLIFVMCTWFTAIAMIEKGYRRIILTMLSFEIILETNRAHKHCGRAILLKGGETSLKRKVILQPRQYFMLFKSESTIIIL